MANHGKLYQTIVDAISSGLLKEPFRSADVEESCPGFAKNTYKNFLAKHAKRNPSGTTELFERIDRGLYCLNRSQFESGVSNAENRETKSSNQFEARRDQYIELLKPLFLPEGPFNDDIIRYFASLLRVLGLEDGGWDPYAESRAMLNDINGFFEVELPEEIFPQPDQTSWRLGLLLYSHIVEMDAPYEVIANLLRFQLGKGYSPNPFFLSLSDFQNNSFRKGNFSTVRKIEFIKQLSQSAGLEVGTIFDDFYNSRLRNAISHSDYILTEYDLRCRGGISGIRAFKIPYAELEVIVMSAKAFIAAYFSVEQLARQVWGTNKQKAIPYDPRYKGLMEILVDDQDLMCGFRVHWPNNSESTYRRTRDGIDMANCYLDLKNATVNLYVDLYARKPGQFSPLVEQGANPVYTKLEGCDEPPVWPV